MAAYQKREKSKSKSLNLSTKSHEGWSQTQAIKELIVNSIDEHDELKKSYSKINIIQHENCITITDQGNGVKLENFCQGNSTKKGKDLRGFHGQGLRGSISRLVLEGHDIYIKSSFIEGNFIEKGENIKILYRQPEEQIIGTEIQIFFNEDSKKIDSIISDVSQHIIYFEQSYEKKIEEITCKDGTLVDIYIPKRCGKIYKGGFFYKGIKIGIGKTDLDFGLIYNIKYSRDLEEKIRGNCNFNRVLQVKDTYKVIENAFKSKPILNNETIRFFKVEIEENYINNGRITPKIKGIHKYKDLARIPLWKCFSSKELLSGAQIWFTDSDHIKITKENCKCEPFESPKVEKIITQDVKIFMNNYTKSEECEECIDILRSQGFTVEVL